MNVKKTLQCAVLVLASALAGAAEASNRPEHLRTATVRFGDLNLNSTEGVAVLYGRIKRAARRVCEVPEDTRQVGIGQLSKDCRIQSTERAVKQVALPALTRLHLERTEGQGKPDRFANKR